MSEKREDVFKAMCAESNRTPRELLAMPLPELHSLAERVTKQTIPDPNKIVECLKEYISGIENS